MVKLRLRRMGAINRPFYRIVAVDSRKKRDGGYLDNIGYYDPKTEPLTLKVHIDKAIDWLSKGAQPSDTVRSLFKKAGVLEKWHNIRMNIKNDKEDATEEIVKEDPAVEEVVEAAVETEEPAESEE